MVEVPVALQVAVQAAVIILATADALPAAPAVPVQDVVVAAVAVIKSKHQQRFLHFRPDPFPILQLHSKLELRFSQIQ